jgi:hypothetical protein
MLLSVQRLATSFMKEGGHIGFRARDFFEAQNPRAGGRKVNVLDEAFVFEYSIRDFFEAQKGLASAGRFGLAVLGWELLLGWVV